MSPTSQPARPQVRYQFIDSSNDTGDNLTQVKRHVMQEFMRHKRETQRQDTSSDDNNGDSKKKKQKKANTAKRQRAQKTRACRTSSSNETPTKSSKRRGEEKTGAVHVKNIPLLVTRPRASPWEIDFSTSPSGSSDSFDDFPVAAYNSPTLSASSFSPKTLLSAARTDPFDTMPLQMTARDQQLFDFYAHEMPSCSYGHHFRTGTAHNWYTEVFVPEAMKGSLTFVNTVLVHAANTQAWLRGQTDTEETLFYRDRAITMLKNHMFRYPHDISDNAITACMSAAALEDFDPRPERKKYSWHHMRHARRMIRQRGGPAAFEGTKLAMLINWQDYILAGYESGEGGFHFESEPVSPIIDGALAIGSSSMHALPSPPCSVTSFTIDCASSEIVIQCDAFLDFLNRCGQLAISQQATEPYTLVSNRHTAFQSGSLLHRILSSPNAKRMTASGDRKQFITRLASVMMLNAALWDYRASAPRTEIFLGHVVSRVLGSEVNISSSTEALLQILLGCQDFPADFAFDSLDLWQDDQGFPDYSQYSTPFGGAGSPSARPWFIGRMLKVAKRLSFDSWRRVNDFLFSCLTLQVNEPNLPLWESELRQEILNAPLTSYIMPALQ